MYHYIQRNRFIFISSNTNFNRNTILAHELGHLLGDTMGIFITGYFLLILSGIVLYYIISTYCVKISAFLIDFIALGLGFYISIKDKLDNKLAIFLSFTVVIIYAILLVLINQKLPKISKLLNYIIAFIGSKVAYGWHLIL